MATSTKFVTHKEGKEVKYDHVFEVTDGDWTYRILKVNRLSKGNGRYQTAECRVQSPYTHGGWDGGAEYLSKIPGFKWNEGKQEYINPEFEKIALKMKEEGKKK